MNDSLESNDDLERLFQVLSKYQDFKGENAVFTPLSVVANPNFEMIEKCNYQNYFLESFTETCKRYPNHDRVHQLWLNGIDNKVFVPQFHGREHLNTLRWMRALRNKYKGTHILFKHQSIGASMIMDESIPEHLAAFDPEYKEDILGYSTIIKSGLSLFNSICGYKARYFIAPNSSEPKEVEKDLKENGIDLISRYKLNKYPLGNNMYTNELNWLGKKNKLDQIVLTRNCGFEPSDPLKSDWVDSCLVEIKNAFYWNKPAIISSHRVNYISTIHEKNGSHGLLELDNLLKRIKENWPEVEFLTTEELGNIIQDAKT
jgi:hypothetical protein